METRATYTTFTVAPEPEPTLAQLHLLKQQYIARGLDQFNALALIVSVFGSPVEINTRDYQVWQRGRITALYHVEKGLYLPECARFEEIQSLAVWLDCSVSDIVRANAKTKVCYLKVSDNDRAFFPDQHFIPGQWLAAMLSEYEAARAIYDAQQDEIKEAARLALMKELMIGQDI